MHLLHSRLIALAVFSLLAISCKHEILKKPVDEPPVESSTCSTDTAYFQQSVLPIFVSNCTMSGCHNQETHQGDLILDSYARIMGSGTIRPYFPNNSKAYKLIIETNPGDRMPPPPYPPLSQEQKNIIAQWIQQGALNNSCRNSCDTAVFTYAAAIRPLISSRCQGCHSGGSPQGGIDLSTYAGVKARVNDGKLWGSLNHLPGYSPMPKNASMLTSCELTQVQKWISAGAANN